MSDRVAGIQFFTQANSIVLPSANPNDAGMRYALLGSAVYVDPAMGMAWYQLAMANQEMHLPHGAISCFKKVIELGIGEKPGDVGRSEYTNSLVNTAYLFYILRRFEEAREYADMAIDFEPTASFAWGTLSQIESIVGDSDRAIGYAEYGLSLAPNDPAAEMALGFAHLFGGNFEKGLKFHEARYPQRLKHFLSYPFPKWGGEPDKTLFLVSEQGIGDALSFSRFVEIAAKRSKHIHIAVQPPLLRLFNAAFQHLKNITIVGLPTPFPAADAWTTFMSLPTHMGLTNDEIINQPQINIAKFSNNPSWKNPDAKLHVGIAWAGSNANDIDFARSFNIEQFAGLAAIPGVQLYSLQVGDRASDISKAGFSPVIRDLNPNITDLSDTAAILRQLDCAVLVESAVAHLAGHVGLETYIPYSFFGRDFRHGRRGGKPLWYDKSLAIQQGPDMAWEPVFSKIEKIIRGKVDAGQRVQAAE